MTTSGAASEEFLSNWQHFRFRVRMTTLIRGSVFWLVCHFRCNGVEPYNSVTQLCCVDDVSGGQAVADTMQGDMCCGLQPYFTFEHDCLFGILVEVRTQTWGWGHHYDIIKSKYFPCYWPFVRARSTPEQTVEQTIDTAVIWDAIELIMTSL